jgi:hypothetical protein
MKLNKGKLVASLSAVALMTLQLSANALCPAVGTTGHCPPTPGGACNATTELGSPDISTQTWCQDCDGDEVKHILSETVENETWIIGCLVYDADSQTYSTTWGVGTCQVVVVSLYGPC